MTAFYFDAKLFDCIIRLITDLLLVFALNSFGFDDVVWASEMRTRRNWTFCSNVVAVHGTEI